MFFKDNSPDYTAWSKWVHAHGLNHCRVRVLQPRTDHDYKPYLSAGGGKYDVTRFDPAFWQRFRAICQNLSENGIFMHVWKWMMAKNQFIDIYQKGSGPDYPDDYDPSGHNGFEEDAQVLRAFWNTLTDYANLDYAGRIASGPGFRKMVLSSRQEAVAYMASKMGQIGVDYAGQEMTLTDLALVDGRYTVHVWRPAAPHGLVQTLTKPVRNGSLTLQLPPFTDDIAVHVFKRTPFLQSGLPWQDRLGDRTYDPLRPSNGEDRGRRGSQPALNARVPQTVHAPQPSATVEGSPLSARPANG